MSKCIGIFYPGEMGVALASVLRAEGHRLISNRAGRSERTLQRCRDAGITLCDSVADVVRQAEIVLSVLPGNAAEEMARAYGAHAATAPTDAIYVDCNSIGPDLSRRLAGIIESSGRSYVDAAINGLAKNLTSGCTLFLSGQKSEQVAALLNGKIQTRCLGAEPGQASAMKMLLSGCSKGLCALFAEAAFVAHEQNLLPEMVDTWRRIYPGVMQVVDRMFPTYAQHAARRANETAEVEQTARQAGVEPIVYSGVRELHERLAALEYPAGQPWSAESLAQYMAEALSAPHLAQNEKSKNGRGSENAPPSRRSVDCLT